MTRMFRPLFAGAAALALLAAPGQAAPPKSPAKAGWVGAWAYAVSPAVETPRPTRPAGTYRYRLRLTQHGDGVTLRLANPEEAIPLAIASISIARATGAEGYAGDGDMPLTFAGSRTLTLQAAQSATSDPARLTLRPGEELIVTLTTAAESTDVAGNAGFRGDFRPAGGGDATVSKSRPYVSLVAVHNPAAPCTIVTLGDSITEGARNLDTVRRGWPDRFADRLRARDPAHHCGVVNAGISGNRVLTYGRGAAAVDRFERDVAAVPGVSHVVMLEGINDITRNFQDSPTTPAALIAGYRRIIAMAHARGIRIYLATLTPGWGYRLTSPAWEAFRAEVNRWIRTAGEADAVIDLETAMRSDAEIPTLRADYDSGDHIHPGDAGYQAMADAVPVELFDGAASRLIGSRR